MTPESIASFYKENKPVLPPDSKYRHYRFVYEDGKNTSAYAVWRVIKSPEQLQKICEEKKPSAVYFTVSRWLRPDYLGARYDAGHSHSKWLANNFLGAHFVIDFDSGIDESYKNMKRAYAILKDKYSDFIFVRTGRGFHLHVLDFEKDFPFIASPFAREIYNGKQRAKLAGLLQRNGVVFDVKTSVDTRRIVRVFNTLHSNGTVIYSTADINDDRLLHPSHWLESGTGEPIRS